MKKAIEKFIRFAESINEQNIIQMRKDYQDTLITKKIKIYEKNKHLPNNIEEVVLDELIDEYNKNNAFYFNNVADVVIKDLKKSKSEWENHPKIFLEFDGLSEILNKSDLNLREKLQIVERLLENNLYKFNENSMVLDTKEILNLNQHLDNFCEFLMSEKFNSFLLKKEEIFTYQELKYIRIIENYANACGKSKKSKALSMLKRYFIDKRKTFNKSELEIIIKSFNDIGISKNLCDEFEYLLNKELKNRENKDKVQKETPVIKNEEKPILSKKEYNNIFKEIETYYDIQNQKVTRQLSLDEIIYLVSLLNKINIAESEIIKCIQNINKQGLKVNNNPFAEFNMYYEKMLQCNNNPEVAIALENIKNYLAEIYIPDNEESYIFWKEAVASELQTIKPILNRNYQYELEMGKKQAR